METKLGKIQKARFGFGGYQDVQIGLWLVIGGDGWGTHRGIEGGWSLHIKHSEHCKWTGSNRDEGYARMCREIQEVMLKAKVEEVNQLVGKPVEVVFDGMILKSWRILTEVL